MLPYGDSSASAAATPAEPAPAPDAAPALPAAAIETSTPAVATEPVAPQSATAPVAPAAPVPAATAVSPLGAATTAPPPEAPAPVAPEVSAIPPAAPAPTYPALNLPEGITLSPAVVPKLDGLLAEMQIAAREGRLDETMPQFRQRLADVAMENAPGMMQAAVAAVQERQAQAWESAKEHFKQKWRADPQIGGERYERNLQAMGADIEWYGRVAGPQHEAEFREFLDASGLGYNPTFARYVLAHSRFITEASRPVPATSQSAPKPTGRAQRRYAGSTNAAGAGAS
jgi:hypothetical protein